MGERRQQRSPIAGLRPLLPLVVVWSLGYGLLAVLTIQNTIPYEALLLDPSAYGRLPWYTGVVSQLGIVGWTTAGTVAAGGAWATSRAGRPGAARLLTGAAVLTTILGVDDLFQVHVTVPQLLGLPKTAAYMAYVTAAGVWMMANRPELARTRWILLAAAGATFAASITADQFGTGTGLSLVAEDGFKFLGILAWATFMTTTAVDTTRSALESSRSRMAVAAGEGKFVGVR